MWQAHTVTIYIQIQNIIQIKSSTQSTKQTKWTDMRWMFPVMKILWSTSSQEWKFSGAKVLCVEQKSIILHNAHCEVSSMQWPLCGLPKLPLNNAITAKRKLRDTVKARKLAYYGHTMRKQGNCLEKEIMQGTMPGAHAGEEDHTRPG